MSIGAAATAGIGAGTVLSPIPWKLMDDSSIWTQNWPWTPVPEDGKITYDQSVCTLCPGHCGISVRKIDNRVVKIEGTEGHPVNDGGICPIGASGPQLLYGPSRIKGPLLKAGNGFKEITWQEAITIVAAKLQEIRKAGKPESVACIAGSKDGIVPALFERFLTVYGSPNFLCPSTSADTASIALNLIQGIDISLTYDLENSDHILSFGSGLIEGWGAPVRMFRAHSSWKTSHAKVCQIEPRQSNTAAKADQWIPVEPGTEAVLALGLAHIIIKKGIFNKAAVNEQATGFDAFERFVLQMRFAPEEVGKYTGVEPSVIERLAEEFANARRPIALWGKGKGQQPGDINEFLSIYALNLLVGNINKPGGVLTAAGPDYIQWPRPQMDAVAQKGLRSRRIDADKEGKYSKTKYLLDNLPKVINAQKESPVELLFVLESNPCYTMADTDAVNKAFDKIPFIVSFSSYNDETVQKADLILPNHTYLERYEDIPGVAGFPKPIIGLSKPVVKPQFNTKHVGNVLIRIAKEMKGNISAAFPWPDFEVCLKSTLGNRWNDLVQSGYYEVSDIETTLIRGSKTAALQKLNFAKAIQYFKTSVGEYPGVTPEGDETYQLTLIPYDSIRVSSGYIGNTPFAIKTVPDTILKKQDILVEINPKTAKALKLEEGDLASLITPVNTITVKTHLFEGIKPGVIALPRGLGHTAYDDYLGHKGENVNKLMRPIPDSATGLNAAWGIKANLIKA